MAKWAFLILYMLSVIKCHFKTMPVYYVGLRVTEHTDFAARKTDAPISCQEAVCGSALSNSHRSS